MAIDYVSLAATATRLLNENGKANALLRVTGVTTSDPVEGTVTFGTAVDTAVNAVLVNFHEKYFEGALIESGDEFYVLDVRANPEDELVIDAVARKVVEVWPIQPGDTFLACRVQVRV